QYAAAPVVMAARHPAVAAPASNGTARVSAWPGAASPTWPATSEVDAQAGMQAIAQFITAVAAIKADTDIAITHKQAGGRNHAVLQTQISVNDVIGIRKRQYRRCVITITGHTHIAVRRKGIAEKTTHANTAGIKPVGINGVQFGADTDVQIALTRTHIHHVHTGFQHVAIVFMMQPG